MPIRTRSPTGCTHSCSLVYRNWSGYSKSAISRSSPLWSGGAARGRASVLRGGGRPQRVDPDALRLSDPSLRALAAQHVEDATGDLQHLGERLRLPDDLVPVGRGEEPAVDPDAVGVV